MISPEIATKIITFYENEVSRLKKEIDSNHSLESNTKYREIFEHLQIEGQKTITKYQKYITEFKKVLLDPEYKLNLQCLKMIIQDYKEQKEYLEGTSVCPINEEVLRMLSSEIRYYK